MQGLLLHHSPDNNITTTTIVDIIHIIVIATTTLIHNLFIMIISTDIKYYIGIHIMKLATCLLYTVKSATSDKSLFSIFIHRNSS